MAFFPCSSLSQHHSTSSPISGSSGTPFLPGHEISPLWTDLWHLSALSSLLPPGPGSRCHPKNDHGNWSFLILLVLTLHTTEHTLSSMLSRIITTVGLGLSFFLTSGIQHHWAYLTQYHIQVGPLFRCLHASSQQQWATGYLLSSCTALNLGPMSR